MKPALTRIELPGLAPIQSGKVREVFDLGPEGRHLTEGREERGLGREGETASEHGASLGARHWMGPAEGRQVRNGGRLGLVVDQAHQVDLVVL